MVEDNIVDFLYAGDPDRRADEIWTALKERSRDGDDVEASGERGDFWPLSWFRWRRLERTGVRAFEGNDGPERWTVPDVPHVEFRYETDIFLTTARGEEEKKEARRAVEDLLDLMAFAYSATDEPPQFAYAVSGAHLERLAANEVAPPATAKTLADDRINYACWAMLFPPRLVDTYGRETLLSAPAWRTEELEDGAVLVVAYPDPLAAGRTKPIDDHLGLDSPPLDDELDY